MTEKELKQYKEFMSTPCNSYNCKNCPANEGRSHPFEQVLPCGQFNCWVDIHKQHKLNKIQEEKTMTEKSILNDLKTMTKKSILNELKNQLTKNHEICENSRLHIHSVCASHDLRMSIECKDNLYEILTSDIVTKCEKQNVLIMFEIYEQTTGRIITMNQMIKVLDVI